MFAECSTMGTMGNGPALILKPGRGSQDAVELWLTEHGFDWEYATGSDDLEVYPLRRREKTGLEQEVDDE